MKRARKVYLFDYSKTELKQAKEIYGDKIETKAGDIYKLPFKDDELDGLMMVRVTHHLKDMKKATAELYRVLKPGGVAVIEVANKRTLPKMARFITGRSKVNPFDKKVANYKEISKDGFYNYHPKYVEEIFEKAGFNDLETAISFIKYSLDLGIPELIFTGKRAKYDKLFKVIRDFLIKSGCHFDINKAMNSEAEFCSSTTIKGKRIKVVLKQIIEDENIKNEMWLSSRSHKYIVEL